MGFGFGLVFMQGIWLYVMIFLTILLYIVCGYYKEELDDAMGPVCMLGTLGMIFWPITLAVLLTIGFVAIPVWFGKMIRKSRDGCIKKKRGKEEFMRNIDKIKKSRN